MELSGVTLQKLRIFQVVFEKGSFNKSAAMLHMSQAAVSQHIRSLEAALNVQLLLRSAKGVRPTEAGELLYKRANEILQLVQQTGLELSSLNTDNPKQLMIGATPGAGAYILPVWLAKYQQRYPQIKMRSTTQMTRETTQAVLAGKVDFGVTLGAIDDLGDQQLAQHVLWEVEYVAIVPPNHPWQARASVTADDIRQAPFIARQQGSRSRRWLAGLFGNLNICAELDSPFATKQAVLNAVGVSILPSYIVQRELERGELIAVTVERVKLTRPLLLLWRRDRAFSAAQTAFWQMVVEDHRDLDL